MQMVQCTKKIQKTAAPETQTRKKDKQDKTPWASPFTGQYDKQKGDRVNKVYGM